MAERPRTLVLQQYDRLIGRDLDGPSADGCLTKAPGRGDRAGRSPVERGKQDLKGATVTDGYHGYGSLLHAVSAGANRHEAPMPGPTLAGSAKLGARPDDITAHLDRGYDSTSIRALLVRSGSTGEIARKEIPAPVRLGQRWVVGRANA